MVFATVSCLLLYGDTSCKRSLSLRLVLASTGLNPTLPRAGCLVCRQCCTLIRRSCRLGISNDWSLHIQPVGYGNAQDGATPPARPTSGVSSSIKSSACCTCSNNAVWTRNVAQESQRKVCCRQCRHQGGCSKKPFILPCGAYTGIVGCCTPLAYTLQLALARLFCSSCYALPTFLQYTTPD